MRLKLKDKLITENYAKRLKLRCLFKKRRKRINFWLLNNNVMCMTTPWLLFLLTFITPLVTPSYCWSIYLIKNKKTTEENRRELREKRERRRGEMKVINKTATKLFCGMEYGCHKNNCGINKLISEMRTTIFEIYKSRIYLILV